MTQKYDVVIIGAGPAGMTAATYVSRANLSVMMIDKGIYGGQMNDTAEVENYPAFDSILGPDLAEKMYASSTRFGAEYTFGEVQNVIDHGKTKTIVTDDEQYEAKVVIVASGATHRHIGVPGEDKYSGRGVSYCAVCDGAFFKNEQIVVIGGGDSAVEEASYLANLAKDVTIVHRRDQLRASRIAQKRAFDTDNIDFSWNKRTEEIIGDDEKVTGVKVLDKISNQESVIKTNGVFIYVGIDPNTQGLENLGILDEKGWVLTDDNMQTKVPGIYAVGDVRKDSIRQIAAAVGDGAVAGKILFDYIQSLSDTEIEA
ncbi:thioredoxin-disulfide reductase [Oenococcus oeni]|uniref:Thioredoxin reductase n=1 Tax=Oenococcus oeni TaxID=1247 RepID=A0A483BFF7_OENOE|nr:thioredoxin-disulfide reductase [Oenococcus oeni]OIK87820.1 thioredoxin-disulfide reductase [Oenococcus oeni]OIL10029.1 thioredoxin-disulfide reductase [Oenococcus oeni]OIL15296.1 thioredoxin-disulfide reductase [Oenococcus oeni]OIM21770.1 thioredoxin-disulfide reductase [Oenococcus oeni]OIM25792.1 thioredoxin-disulfide reductase [Oenococcus oeni]